MAEWASAHPGASKKALWWYWEDRLSGFRILYEWKVANKKSFHLVTKPWMYEVCILSFSGPRIETLDLQRCWHNAKASVEYWILFSFCRTQRDMLLSCYGQVRTGQKLFDSSPDFFGCWMNVLNSLGYHHKWKERTFALYCINVTLINRKSSLSKSNGLKVVSSSQTLMNLHVVCLLTQVLSNSFFIT